MYVLVKKAGKARTVILVSTIIIIKYVDVIVLLHTGYFSIHVLHFIINTFRTIILHIYLFCSDCFPQSMQYIKFFFYIFFLLKLCSCIYRYFITHSWSCLNKTFFCHLVFLFYTHKSLKIGNK
jgi:hypothetical protein